MSAYPPTVVFAQDTNTTPEPTTYYGMTGWFKLPGGWAVKPNPNCSNELIASPAGDFVTPPTYYCCLAEDNQTYVFQDLLLSKYAGTTGNNNGHGRG